MPKQLLAAFTAEGSTDKDFLLIIIRRTLEAIAREYGQAFEIYSLEWLGGSKGDKTVLTAVRAYENGAQLLFIHRDTDQHTLEHTISVHIGPIQKKLTEDNSPHPVIVPLIIKHEQETWMLVDFDKLNEILGGKVERQLLNIPPNIESRANTKEIMKQVLRHANLGETRGKGYTMELISELLADELDLDLLANLHSYKAFKAATVAALRELNYLPPAQA